MRHPHKHNVLPTDNSLDGPQKTAILHDLPIVEESTNIAAEEQRLRTVATKKVAVLLFKWWKESEGNLINKNMYAKQRQKKERGNLH